MPRASVAPVPISQIKEDMNCSTGTAHKVFSILNTIGDLTDDADLVRTIYADIARRGNTTIKSLEPILFKHVPHLVDKIFNEYQRAQPMFKAMARLKDAGLKAADLVRHAEPVLTPNANATAADHAAAVSIKAALAAGVAPKALIQRVVEMAFASPEELDLQEALADYYRMVAAYFADHGHVDGFNIRLHQVFKDEPLAKLEEPLLDDEETEKLLQHFL